MVRGDGPKVLKRRRANVVPRSEAYASCSYVFCATQRSKLNASKPRSKRWLSGLNGDGSRLGNLRGERSSSLALRLASAILLSSTKRLSFARTQD